MTISEERVATGPKLPPDSIMAIPIVCATTGLRAEAIETSTASAKVFIIRILIPVYR
jgi:hypothetical protein